MERRPDKFNEIYYRYVDLVQERAYDITGDFHIAQDISQDVFTKLYRYLDSLDEDKVKGWLIVLSTNLALDYRKKGSSRREICVEDIQETSDGRAALPEYQVNVAGYRQLCEAMLRDLYVKNQKWFEAYMAAEYLEVPRKLVAAQMNVSLSSVDQYIRKSKRWLKKHFQQDYDALL